MSVQIDRDSNAYVLQAETVVPRALDDVFAFFADPHNLEKITPPFLRFRIVTKGPLPMREGLIVDYALRMRGLPLRWRSEIRAWDPPCGFTDEQVRGPYLEWKHEHRFVPEGETTRVIDRVRYRVPAPGWLHDRLVRPDLETIFCYRNREILRLLQTEGSAS